MQNNSNSNYLLWDRQKKNSLVQYELNMIILLLLITMAIVTGDYNINN